MIYKAPTSIKNQGALGVGGSKCLVFAFGFETRIKTILPLINEALLVADHVPNIELLRHKTLDFTPLNRLDISSVDYRLLRVIQECVCQKQQGT